MRSIVAEDEPEIAAFVARLLGQLNGVVDIVGTLADASHAIASFSYDLAVVDRMLPDGDGLSLVKDINALPQRPAIIMLTARDEQDDLIDGLNTGADDYLGKPFEPQEFSARVRAILRRPRLLVTSTLRYGNVEFDIGTNEVIVGDRKLPLRRREAIILEALMQRRDRVVTREMLIEALYGFNDEIVSNSMEAQMSRLRKRLIDLGGDVEIRNIRGVGYVLRQFKPE